MRSLFPCLLVLSAFLGIRPFAHGEESAASQELRELRQAVQQQSKQLELLAQQIGQLMRVLEAQKPAGAPASAASSENPKSPADPEPEAPRAEPIPKAELAAGVKHAVAKGETLTSIAKQYNIAVTDLKNANKIENERKLQIGQILTVPTAKTPETPDKKENP